jgi:hypothetical protein
MKAVSLAFFLAAFSLAAHAEPPPGHPSIEAARAQGMLPPQIPPLTQEGTVLESFNSGGYTYLQVQVGSKTMWVASQPIEAKKGNHVVFDDGSLMTDFHSSTLNRTFPAILFVSNIGVCHCK